MINKQSALYFIRLVSLVFDVRIECSFLRGYDQIIWTPPPTFSHSQVHQSPNGQADYGGATSPDVGPKDVPVSPNLSVASTASPLPNSPTGN